MQFLVVVALVAGLVAGAWAVYNSSLFSVRRVEVSGNTQLLQSQVVKQSGIQLGGNIFKVDLTAAKKRLVANPWLEAATLSRQLPAIIRIRVRERAAAVALSRPRATYVLDKTGFVLSKEGALADTGLPAVRDLDAGEIKVGTRLKSPLLADALRVLASFSPSLRAKIDTISAPAADKLVFITKEGLEIDYGRAEEMETKNALIARFLKQESGKIIMIDVRTPSNPSLRKLGGVPVD